MGVIVRTKYTRTYIEAPDLWSVLSSPYANRCEPPTTIERESTGELLASLALDPGGYRWDVTDAGEAVFGEAT